MVRVVFTHRYIVQNLNKFSCSADVFRLRLKQEQAAKQTNASATMLSPDNGEKFPVCKKQERIQVLALLRKPTESMCLGAKFFHLLKEQWSGLK